MTKDVVVRAMERVVLKADRSNASECSNEACVGVRAALEERTAQIDALLKPIAAECVEHVELNGHLDLAQQCADYLAHEIMDNGDPSGRIGEFVEALRVVSEQCDRQRRRANWYEAAHTAGKAKLIESAVTRACADLQRAHDFEAQRSNHYKALHSGLMADFAALSDERDSARTALATVIAERDALRATVATCEAANNALHESFDATIEELSEARAERDALRAALERIANGFAFCANESADLVNGYFMGVAQAALATTHDETEPHHGE